MWQCQSEYYCTSDKEINLLVQNTRARPWVYLSMWQGPMALTAHHVRQRPAQYADVGRN